MTASPVSEPQLEVEGASDARFYRFSVMLTGALRMWRATRVTLPVILLNAVLQGVLILPTQSAFTGLTLALTALGSALALVATLAVVTAGALDSFGLVHPNWDGVRRRLAASWVPFVGWTCALFVVVVAGFALWTWPGALLLALGLFVPLSAMDRASPLRATWLIIRRRPVRWAVTVLVVLALGLVAYLSRAVLWFFVPQFVGVAIAGLVWGVLVWWVSTGLAALYLAVSRGRPEVER
ncbi:MAG: hypothetical protein QG597_1978 [Actinomycetota bacterium]|nr:hypothetical protein [Actinomycetota bacterium]